MVRGAPAPPNLQQSPRGNPRLTALRRPPDGSRQTEPNTPSTQPPLPDFLRSPIFCEKMMAATASEDPDFVAATMEQAAAAPNAAEEEAQAAAPPEETIVVGSSSSSSGEVDQNATGSSGDNELRPPSPLTPDDDAGSSSSKGKLPVVERSPQQSPAETEVITTPTPTTNTASTTTTTTTTATSSTAATGDIIGVGAPPPQPTQPDDPRWAYLSDRPPAKLPIYFHDAVGRNYTFPWEKAKTWEVRRHFPTAPLFVQVFVSSNSI